MPDDDHYQVTDADRDLIETLVDESRNEETQAQDTSTFGPLYDNLVDAVAPSVYGLDYAKLGLLFSLVGGVQKSLNDGNTIRGAINILFVHDPGLKVPNLATLGARLAPRAEHFDAESGRGDLLEGDPSTSPKELSHLSTATLSGASHAVVTGFGETSRGEFDQLQAAFAPDSPTGHPSSSSDSRTTALVATTRPRHGRFDPFEPLVRELELPTDFLPGFDLLFVLPDKADVQSDRETAEAILETNYLGELRTQQSQADAGAATSENSHSLNNTVETEVVDIELLRKHIAYAREDVHPTLTESARKTLRDFYVDVRSQGADEDAPVPITALKLEALVRLAEASARLRLSETAENEDANRAIKLVRRTLEDLGNDPDQGELDEDVIETGSAHADEQEEQVKDIIRDIQDDSPEGAPREEVLKRAELAGIERDKAEHEIQKLRDKGEAYSPSGEHLRIV